MVWDRGERARERAERAAQRAAEIAARIGVLQQRRRRLAEVAGSAEADVTAARRAAAKALADAIEAHRHSAAAHRDNALMHREEAERLALLGQPDRAAAESRAAVLAEHAAEEADASAAHAARIWSREVSDDALSYARLNRDARVPLSAAGDEGRVEGPASAGGRGPRATG